ncbi:MAG: hypothetical protein PHR77_16620 [Kiritimatiellae bacterium]|nr:hypothetical protein [Kiritimatiellia bacterium]MDD5521609.1 hypothetical protein [Kiritimatiellia bacterium]
MIRSIAEIINYAARLDSALNFGSLFVWLAGWYILYQMTRLGFLKFLIAGYVIYVIDWFIRKRHYFIGHFANKNVELAISYTDVVINISADILVLIGICMGVSYLQRKWKDKENANKGMNGTR